MNKTAIKNFAIWARNKLIADISYKAGLLGIKEKGINSPLPQSTQTVHFFDIGTKEPSSITGTEIQQRKKLVEEIERKAKQSDYATAYKNVIEEVAYTWFNRLIAIRFMEVNDYLPTRIRVLSSESNGKAEPDLVTHALEASLDYSAYEKDRIIQLKLENKLDELFRVLFIKQCNALNGNLPELFERTSDYTELLLNVSFTDKEGVVFHLVNDISEDDFNVSKEGQVEIIGWLYQYYNTEPKDETFALLKKNVKITKERVPAVTQLFTPDWIVRYMVENSLGRLWLEGHPNDELKSRWEYYLDEPGQDEEVQKQLNKIREEYQNIKPEDIKVIDPAMGSGHILVYAFELLMQIYGSYGYSERDAAKSIVENNLYGLDIDNRAYQLAYFAVMMKARQYNRRILSDETKCHVYAIQESNDINRNQLNYFGTGLSEIEKNSALLQILGLLDTFTDAKEYGSILDVKKYNWKLLRNFIKVIDADGQMAIESIGIEFTRDRLCTLIEIGEVMASKYDVVITNPPYLGSNGMNIKLSEYVKENYFNSKSDLGIVFIERCIDFSKSNKFIALIVMHTWMHTITYEKFRISLLDNISIQTMIHLGTRAFEDISGEVVQTTSFTMVNTNIDILGRYIDLTEYKTNKEEEIYNCKNQYTSSKKVFSSLPGNPISYDVGISTVDIIKSNEALGKYAVSRPGLQTSDNERFLKLWFEVQFSNIGIGLSRDIALNSEYKWFPHNKGGGNRRWYGNIDYVINFYKNGRELKYWIENNPQDPSTKHWSRNLRNYEYYLKDGLTWSSMSQGSFATRMNGEGFFFDTSGPMIFGEKLGYICAFTNSKVFLKYNKIFSRTLSTSSNSVSKVPLIVRYDKEDYIEEIVKNNVSLSKKDWDSFETSWDFKHHPLLGGNSVKLAFEKWQIESLNRFNQVKSFEEEINRIFIDMYELQDELTPSVEEGDVTVSKSNIGRDIRSLISYAVGCMFGRYSIDWDGLAFAGGQWLDSRYSTFLPDKDNILPITDEEYFKDDIVGLFIDFVKKGYGQETLEENLDFIANALGRKGNGSRDIIRNYFMNEFYKDHCKIYQKRPIYWLFDGGKQNGFKALVYMHRYDENTIGNLRIDYLHRMQRIYENEIARMQDAIENSKDAREVAAATKRKEKLIKQLQETKEYDEKIAHLALARTSIDLDDGVKVNYEKVQTDRDGKKLDVLAKI